MKRYGGIFISDEVQTGWGRTGGRWFGIEQYDVVPDVMTAAKGIANGFPVGATVTRPGIAEAWQGPSISTYGGNSISMAAMRATLGVMKRENVRARAAARGAQLRAGLEALKRAHGWIGEVRGMGLMQGVEMVEERAGRAPDGERAGALLEAAREERLLIGRGGLYGHVIRIGPSLLIAEDEMAEGIRRLTAACRRVDG